MAVELEQSAAFLEPILGAHQQACVVSSRSSVAPAVALRTARAPAGGLRKWGRRRPQMKYLLSPPASTRRRCAVAGIELEDCSFSPPPLIRHCLFSRGSIPAHRHLYVRRGGRRRRHPDGPRPGRCRRRHRRRHRPLRRPPGPLARGAQSTQKTPCVCACGLVHGRCVAGRRRRRRCAARASRRRRRTTHPSPFAALAQAAAPPRCRRSASIWSAAEAASGP